MSTEDPILKNRFFLCLEGPSLVLFPQEGTWKCQTAIKGFTNTAKARADRADLVEELQIAQSQGRLILLRSAGFRPESITWIDWGEEMWSEIQEKLHKFYPRFLEMRVDSLNRAFDLGLSPEQVVQFKSGIFRNPLVYPNTSTTIVCPEGDDWKYDKEANATPINDKRGVGPISGKTAEGEVALLVPPRPGDTMVELEWSAGRSVEISQEDEEAGDASVASSAISLGGMMDLVHRPWKFDLHVMLRATYQLLECDS